MDWTTKISALASAATGCQAYEEWPPPPAPEENKKVETPPITVKTGERAVLAVYEHLLTQAESYKAKAYLADFYTTSDTWSAGLERFKDGTSIWHVVVDMTDVEVWKERPYWQKASWFVLEDGQVIPSNRFQANALRIEVDLQERSLPAQP